MKRCISINQNTNMSNQKKEQEKKWIAVAYFLAEKDDEEWLILENQRNDCDYRVIRGKSLRGQDY